MPSFYADFTDFVGLYGEDKLQESEFYPFALKAQRLMDYYTTGIDNVRKLKVAYPTDEDTISYVKACFCELVDILHEVDVAERSASLARGYEATADGMRAKAISSKSAGNESISYGTASGSVTTAIDKAISDPDEKARLVTRTITGYLSGLTDANGVNLLYMGRYPVKIEV